MTSSRSTFTPNLRVSRSRVIDEVDLAGGAEDGLVGLVDSGDRDRGVLLGQPLQ